MEQITTADASEQLTVAHPHGEARQSYMAKALRFLARIHEYCRELGVVTGLRWYAAKILTRLPLSGTRRILVRPPELLHPVTVRMFPSSDDFVFDQLFVRHEYAPVCRREGEAKFVLDLGANVGYASAIFASRYPGAKILAVEPDPRNYEACTRNLAPYGGRVQTLLGAVWTKQSRLTLVHGNWCGGREWGTRVGEAPAGSDANVEAWDIGSLLDMAQVEEADLVKIDIEGSEAEVFAAETARWLPRIRNLCIELHDEKCREIFFRAMAGFDYELEEHGEYTFCFDLRAVPMQQGA
ncbi:MAG TPA: FkbM family methyltransferase [Bryobacteraceae bacterium]|nr:FkbM family methyltransferase [Bryobacteraceae bacterium]